MHTEDYSIIEQCRNGNAEAYAVLVGKYQRMVYNVAYRMLGDGETANDIAQDSFIAAYEGLKRFRNDAKFSTWLCGITINKCRDHLKGRKPHVPMDEIAEPADSKALNPEEELARKQSGKGIQRALEALPEDYREVIILKHIRGLDYKEMEEILGVGVGALKVRTHRARELLKKHLVERGVLYEG